ncbi:2Fe-2S iron-sulfur cluster-binding protein [Vibrio sp. SCSIO 43137]|uniref:2Fe-2S iron-sulfur cluster-binding protein n=1 Tax=Vibrio sp. SCSIO 43137 TaxID=3021011 RepID=UPI002306EB9C|nr:2Fe-2S iron-sulfur cluster-binding protein [Vibrio sp. SCSIO 43137]WCE29652.1 2Fe-2S iron-sulfur cluster-binding protein [Vibrio sp. SCSIO 43137]
MTYKVTLYPAGIEFDVPEGSTVLEAALNNNIEFPNRCQVGVCSMCMCRKLEGRIEYHLDPILTDKEQKAGWMFPCLAYVKSDTKLTFEE